MSAGGTPQKGEITFSDTPSVKNESFKVRLHIKMRWESHEQELNGETAPWKNETIAQCPIDVICTEETPKPGVKTDVFWHGVAWDGTQTKASKPK